MANFKCQLPNHDLEDDWGDVEAFHAEDAAHDYIKRRDDGDDFLKDPMRDKETVAVKDEAGEVFRFTVTVDYEKIYMVREA